jgi:hypothetical protein
MNILYQNSEGTDDMKLDDFNNLIGNITCLSNNVNYA